MFDFYKGNIDQYIEGFLDRRNDKGDTYDKKAKILFLLREPNNPDQQDFWFRRILDDNYDEEHKVYFRNAHNLNYFNTFASIAAYLLHQTSTSHDEVSAIASCAYINLFARRGKGISSTEYKSTREHLSNLLRGEDLKPKKIDTEESITRARCVYNLLKDFITSGTETIVTVCDIYNMISGCCRKYSGCRKNEVWLTLGYKNQPERRRMAFNCRTVRLFDHEVKMYNFWHPSYRFYDFSLLKEELKDYYVELPEHN